MKLWTPWTRATRIEPKEAVVPSRRITHVILWSNGLATTYDDHGEQAPELKGKAVEVWRTIRDAVAFQDPPPYFDCFDWPTNQNGERIDAAEWYRRAAASKPDTMTL